MKFSIELARSTPVDVAKADRIPAGSVATPLAQLASQLTETRASGSPPDPGPVPTEQPSPTTEAVEPVGHAPMRYSFPYAINQTHTPRGENRSLTPFAQLRNLGEVCDLVRIAVEARKDQMTQLKWDFAPRERSHAKKMSDTDTARVKQLRDFFRKPDKIHGWNTWLRMLIEEVLIIDALSIYKRRTRGGKLYSLELIDGTTIKPLLSRRGFVPLPPSVAYRQIITGVPVAGGDCTVEQLLYRPRTVRTWTPYGLSATESVMLTINTALNRQLFNLGYYSEGNVPEGLVSTPEGWSVDQIAQFQDYWDAMIAGNYKARQRLRFVGPKMAESVYQFKKESFDTKFDEFLLQVVCAAFNVQPQELGFTQQINKSQGEAQENVTYRRMKPLANFIKDINDETLVDELDAADFECIFTGGESEDRKAQAEVDNIYVRIGKVSIDELRARDGEDDAETAKAIDAELRTFKSFIVNRVKRGKTLVDVAKSFESAVLPLDVRERIVNAIVEHDTGTLGVATVFEQVEKAAAPKRVRAQAQSRYRKFMKSYFSDLADALAAHVGDAVAKE
jgi:hypothetical protein